MFVGIKPLNLFAGPNSSGKSTALQALLIASDNVTETKGKHGLRTGGLKHRISMM